MLSAYMLIIFYTVKKLRPLIAGQYDCFWHLFYKQLIEYTVSELRVMGYIQFDKVDVPSSNVVPLSQLSEQWKLLQQQEEEYLHSAVAKEISSANEHVSTVAEDLQSNYCIPVNAIEETWQSFMSTNNADLLPHSSLESSGIFQEASLDEEMGCVFSRPSHLCTPEPTYDYLFKENFPCPVSASISPDGPLKSNEDEFLPSEKQSDVEYAFRCVHCPSKFKIKGYLTRHLKKHASRKEYSCPYWLSDRKCHPTGGFSRKDTYHTHLKSIHFIYPVGTSRCERKNSSGCCAACYQEFSSNSEWLKIHIHTYVCPRLQDTRGITE